MYHSAMVPQRVPEVTEADVERILLRDFSAEDTTKARALIQSSFYGTKPRVVLACLKVAAGNVDTLKKQLKDDWRDVICAAEYPGAAARPRSEIEQLADSELQRIVDSDWQQYSEWLKKV